MLKIILLRICPLVLISVSFFACVRGEDILKNSKKFKGKDELPEKTSDTVTLISLENEKIIWYLKAKHIIEFAKKKQIYAKEIEIYAFDDNDRIVSTMTADSARINEVKKMLEARSNVKILSENGVLETTKIYWNLANNSVFTQENVKITRGDNVMYGNNLYTDIELNSAKLDNIKGEGEVEAQKFNF